ncbi:MAG: transcription antitermination factor NusB [Elusimicrobia bacterium]|nr:transcription antitermination factor NusB [Elusimicrobiota bacterium]
MGSRRSARELCLQALYLWDNCKLETGQAWLAASSPSISELSTDEEHSSIHWRWDDSVKSYARGLYEGVLLRHERIDALLSSTSTNWKIERMSTVDRNILRLGIYEILEKSDVPVNVIINEAVEIAKKFSAEDSGKFVNAILDRLKNERSGTQPSKEITKSDQADG